MTTKSKRKTQFDIIRILAILMIFNYHFCMAAGKVSSAFCSHKNGGWGSVGTTMFFILSGYLIHLGSKEIHLTSYLKKRFLSIYPALWISFIIVYLYKSISLKNFFWGGEPWRILLSFLGLDTYLQFYYVPTYACVGEWFTTIILFLYLAYVPLCFLIKKYPAVTTLALLILYFLECIKAIQPAVPADASIFTGLLIFWTGMLLQQYPSALVPKWWKVALATAVSLIITFIPLPLIGSSLPWKNLLGFSIFYFAYAIFSKINYNKPVENTLKFLSSISFAVYLIHHFIINLVLERCPETITVAYCISLAATIMLAAVIYKCTTVIKKFF